MTNSLIPTTITDKNGRTTTVHKRLDPNGTKKTATMPAPSLTPSSVTTTRTPLKPLAPLTKEQSAELFEWRKKSLENSHYNVNAKKACLAPMHPEVESLVWKLLKGGSAPEAGIEALVANHQIDRYMWRKYAGEGSVARVQMQLRVIERMAENNATILGYDKSASVIKKAIDGYCYSPKKEDRIFLTGIDSEEELDSLTAVVTFLNHAAHEGHVEQFKDSDFLDSKGKKIQGVWMSNKLLKTHLQENPHELNRVIDYMESREIGTKVKETREMIRHLEESTDLGVLDQGWL